LIPHQRPPRPTAATVKRIALFLVIMVAAFAAIYELAVYLLGAHDALVTAAAALSALLASVINDKIWNKLQRDA
jgi:hypothetical protein